MSKTVVGLLGRGGEADYELGTSEGWGAFSVVRWHGIEEISHPFRYDITLMRQVSDGPIDLDRLINGSATFRIASQKRWRSIHGILAEAEEIDRTSTVSLYRVLLVPHFWRARYRRRCRNFVGRSLKEIITAVLENRSPAHPKGNLGLILSGDTRPQEAHPSFASFTEPKGSYRWAVSNEERINDPTASPYVVQYNETDFDFASRLLEAEGLSYSIEHTQDEAVFTITDAPGGHLRFAPEETFTLRRVNRTGRNDEQEIVRSFRDARRIESRSVTMRDYDFNRSHTPLEATAPEGATSRDIDEHFEFPAGEELIKEQPAFHAAQVRLQRHATVRELRSGVSSVRTMEAGQTFTLHDADGLLNSRKLLAVRVETFATELAPAETILDEEPFGFAGMTGAPSPGYESRFVALPQDVPFRPEMRTPKPRIHGVQTGVVTAEEHGGERPKINADKLGRVRVRFPWDQRHDKNDGTPTSDWIRVSQFWAGAGYGALYTPRVGHEILVAYMQGDPDQPVIVGRVFNAQNPPPYSAAQEPTKSTVKSRSATGTKEVDGFNEIRFEDQAKKEEIFLHAQRDFNEVVLASHSTSVGGDQSNSVMGDQSNSVKGDRTHTIKGSETVHVQGDRTTNFDANEHHTVGAFQDTHIGANETHEVGGFRTTTIGANDDLNVGGWHNTSVGGGETFTIGGKRDVFVGADYNVKTATTYTSEAGSDHVFKSTNTYVYPAGDFQVNSTTAGFNQSASFYVKAGGAVISMSSGIVVISNGAGATIALIGGLISIVSGSALVSSVGGPAVTAASGPVLLSSGGAIGLTAQGDINAKGATIKLNE
ncbi:MAG TPA: type VI secretion system tip protein TssI/VgrG [Polyangiaceae bacterium]|nr:type VI secretion system tip protein TssI/VgrG [Polyangiaceae bacterium]